MDIIIKTPLCKKKSITAITPLIINDIKERIILKFIFILHLQVYFKSIMSHMGFIVPLYGGKFVSARKTCVTTPFTS